VLNKLDLLPEPPPFEVEDERILRVFAISCATGQGVDELRRALFELVPAPAADEAPLELEPADYLVYRPRPDRRPRFRVLRTDRGFRIVGDAPEGEELERALRAAGARRGAVVEIGDEELEVG
jgi:hypothetical protein